MGGCTELKSRNLSQNADRVCMLGEAGIGRDFDKHALTSLLQIRNGIVVEKFCSGENIVCSLQFPPSQL